MSLATMGHVPVAVLSDLVDVVAARTGAWVLVERHGVVLCHGTGNIHCPPPLAQALLGKTTAPLRAAITWTRSGRLVRGKVDGVDLVAAGLGNGASVWLVGGSHQDLQQDLPLLAASVHGNDSPVNDPFVDELLHPRGPVRRGRAPSALLLVLRAEVPAAALARATVAAVAGSTARVHLEEDSVVVALPVDEGATRLLQRLRTTCPSVVGGVCQVDEGTSDWVAAARLATGSLLAAQALGIPLGDPTDPVVAAELVVQEAKDAAADLIRALPRTPLHDLQEYDGRCSGELVASLTAWCRAGFDVPAAANALHVHANTLRYRLKRAGEVSGLDLTRPRQMLALQILLAV